MADLAPWLPPVLALLILAGAVYGWVSERLPTDVTALLALVALLLTGVLTPEETFAGFSHPATLSVAAVLVLSAGLERTGVIGFIARRLLAPVGKSEFLLTLCLMAAIGTMSAFVNNTAAVAVFIPVVLEVCRRTGARPGRVMMPMAYAATLGGLCTLIGTSTNVVGHEFAVREGLAGFRMFDFAAVGLPMALAGSAYILLVGRWFLPAGPASSDDGVSRAWGYRTTVEVLADSPWIGRRAIPQRLRRAHDVELLALMRDGRRRSLTGWTRFREGDYVELSGTTERLLALENLKGVRLVRPAAPVPAQSEAGGGDSGEALDRREVVVLPGSPLVGRTIRDAVVAEPHGTVVLALHRPGEDLLDPSGTVHVRPGDVLVVEGGRKALAAFAREPGVLVIGAPEPAGERTHKLGIALVVLVAVVISVAIGLASILVAATAGCAVLILMRCLRPREAYQAIDLALVFLLAGSLALGTALEKTGVTAFIGTQLGELGGDLGPHFVLGAFFIGAMLVSELMSNSGTVLLLGPVALTTAQQLGLNPMALLAGVIFGASAAFAMPVGYQTSLMILVPGGYRVRDFVRMGVPLDLLLAVIAIWLIPQTWPLVLPPP
ncbi:MAG TPA: SLC13 family permease [Planctomycetota bacterium]|nr:SLC13 family permease [Planctomycetota bacterium]